MTFNRTKLEPVHPKNKENKDLIPVVLKLKHRLKTK